MGKQRRQAAQASSAVKQWQRQRPSGGWAEGGHTLRDELDVVVELIVVFAPGNKRVEGAVSAPR